MTDEMAFVGDVHGNFSALRGMLCALGEHGLRQTVFLGDYINKGNESLAVVEELVVQVDAGRATLLAGNHELALLDALDRADLSGFLKIGGAATIRSYVGGDVGPNVLGDFRAALPAKHLTAFRAMPSTFESPDVLAQHIPLNTASPKYLISAHRPVGRVPRVGPSCALLDTGCGSEGGRLSALLWPSRNVIQVDERGSVVTA